MSENQAEKVTTRAAKVDAFAGALATGHSIESAGRKVGLSPATSYRWAASPDVVEVVGEYRAEIRRQIADTLATGCTLAVATLIEIASDGESENARVKASLGLLSAAQEWIELDHIAQQVAEIEQTLRQAQRPTASVRERARLELIVGIEADD